MKYTVLLLAGLVSVPAVAGECKLREQKKRSVVVRLFEEDRGQPGDKIEDRKLDALEVITVKSKGDKICYRVRADGTEFGKPTCAHCVNGDELPLLAPELK